MTLFVHSCDDEPCKCPCHLPFEEQQAALWEAYERANPKTIGTMPGVQIRGEIRGDGSATWRTTPIT